jgi:hypothetical protein
VVLDKSLFNPSESRNSIDHGKKSNQVCYFTNSAIFSLVLFFKSCYFIKSFMNSITESRTTGILEEALVSLSSIFENDNLSKSFKER